MARIEYSEGGEMISVTTHGIRVDVHVVASDGGIAIGNYDRGDRWVAVQITDFCDGDWDLYASREGDTFGVSRLDEFSVLRAGNDGSLRWSKNE